MRLVLMEVPEIVEELERPGADAKEFGRDSGGVM